MRKTVIILLLVISISIPYASAHPFTIDSTPNSSTNAPVGTTKIIVHFSEPVELDFSFLKVIDSNGEEIDNKDSKYFDGDSSLIVTTPPLEEGVYTVTTKALSKIDGHLVPSAFVFAVGDAKIDVGASSSKDVSDIVFFPEAGSRFPGLVGQTIVLGVLIASILIWGTQNKQLIKKEEEKLEQSHHGKFMKITGIGLLLIFASNILMLAIQAIRLETSVINVIQTNFGNIWLIRMAITIVLLALWFGMDRKKKLSIKNKIPMLAVTLVLIGTSSLIGHGAASGEISAIVLDYIHNFVAAVWIGGIIYFVFTLLPTLSQLEETKREKMTLVLIPRFSIMVVIAVGIVIITGPTLMWLLESNVNLITESIYGKLIFAKIAIAAIMIGFGGYFQFKIQKNAERDLQKGTIAIYKKLKRSLKFDVALGITLLGVVALLSNGTLPAGEINQVDAQKVSYGFHSIEFSEKTKFDVEITPFSSGTNTIFIKMSDFEDKPLIDSNQIKVKISNPQRNIAPIEIPMKVINQEESKPIEFQGEITFGFSGQWQVEIENLRTENANESVILNLLVKPRLSDIKTEIIEYELPQASKPLYPLFDGKDSIWVSDPSAPKLWKFSLDSKNFTSYSFDGLTSIILTKDNQGKIWFTDTPRNQIGYFDPSTQKITTKTLPKIDPVINDNIATFIQADFDGNIWISVTNKDTILKYQPKLDSFEEVKLPTRGSVPFALTIDGEGKIWFTESQSGKIGFINPQNNKISEFSPEEPLASPEALVFDDKGNLWIAEHTGLAITKFDPILETFEKITVPDKDALPYGMAFDKYGNIWIAQHTVDKIAAYDPDNKNLIEVPIPTTTSFAQFSSSDDKGNVWFVEQQGNKLSMIKTTEIPIIASQIPNTNTFQLKYTEIVSPLIAMGIIATSLFFVKNIKDKRRLNELILSG
ncbi:copper resistance D domain-containing protein [Candidatus Nitrosarchaeum limnium SFB1]|jgi:copper transport protein|uniref:Copper resistance D domain-containing protein n=1 Tax=Candidatus Nitrosarchaeum limnium SFB1 TaxID=886738 RepID=F3KLM2_9ARCH|nr:copper resistance D domain-containing protein [Candidatus Nitrosarchaeum limnium SFB1]